MATWDPQLPGVVLLPDGRLIRGRGLRDDPIRDERERPDLAVYLTARPPETTPDSDWESHWVPWPDFRLPRDRAAAVSVLREAHRRATAERVEIACDGGRGRTGTALALLACLSGVPATEAVPWVRRHYRPGAVETPWQRRWVASTAERLEH